MDKAQVRQAIETMLQEQGVDAFGYCSGAPFDHLGPILEEKMAKGHACPMELRPNKAALTTPAEVLPGVQSILVILLPHSPYTHERKPLHGTMATGTATEDYHRLIHERLTPVAKMLGEGHGIDSTIVVDTSPLSDRAMAVRAGLGILRRNNMFYHKKYGSYVHIGALLMTAALHDRDESYQPENPCGACRRCVAHCPGGAIVGDGTINSHRCVSYLTQKKTVNEAEGKAIGQRIYGCDVCQQVCPANRGVKNPSWPLLVPKSIPLEAVLTLSGKAFAETFKRTSSGWRGKRQLQRNALLALANSDDREGALKILSTFKTESPMLRALVASLLEDKQPKETEIKDKETR